MDVGDKVMFRNDVYVTPDKDMKTHIVIKKGDMGKIISVGEGVYIVEHFKSGKYAPVLDLDIKSMGVSINVPNQTWQRKGRGKG